MTKYVEDDGYPVSDSDGYVPAIEAGKRLGLVWTGPGSASVDWFVGWSPRNHSSYAEGPWDHWVDLALKILADPLTEIVRPSAYRVRDESVGFYSETLRTLTAEELAERFPR